MSYETTILKKFLKIVLTPRGGFMKYSNHFEKFDYDTIDAELNLSMEKFNFLLKDLDRFSFTEIEIEDDIRDYKFVPNYYN